LLLFDLGMDVVVPPLTYVALPAFAGLLVSLVWRAFAGPTSIAWFPWAASLFFVACYVLRGVWLSGAGFRGLLDLAWAPVYMVWKVALSVRQRKQRKDEWVRTRRETPRKTEEDAGAGTGRKTQ
jgi:hypothetical protein